MGHLQRGHGYSSYSLPILVGSGTRPCAVIISNKQLPGPLFVVAGIRPDRQRLMTSDCALLKDQRRSGGTAGWRPAEVRCVAASSRSRVRCLRQHSTLSGRLDFSEADIKRTNLTVGYDEYRKATNHLERSITESRHPPATTIEGFPATAVSESVDRIRDKSRSWRISAGRQRLPHRPHKTSASGSASTIRSRPRCFA